MVRPRLIRRSLALYLVTLLCLLFFTDMILFGSPFSSRSSSTYLRAANHVISSLSQISNMERSVLPNQSTVILEPSPGVTCKDSGLGLFSLFVVISAPENVRKREAIRQTFQEMQARWEEQFGEIKAYHNNNSSGSTEDDKVNKVFQLLFFIGQPVEHGMSVRL